MDMSYAFTLAPPGEGEDGTTLAIRIEASDQFGPVLLASFAGERQPLSDANLLKAWLRHPLLAAAVLAAIHWEALKLFLKGVRLTRRPPPPIRFVSFISSASPRQVIPIGVTR